MRGQPNRMQVEAYGLIRDLERARAQMTRMHFAMCGEGVGQEWGPEDCVDGKLATRLAALSREMWDVMGELSRYRWREAENAKI